LSLQLFGQPFSFCTMKALIALYKNETPFDLRVLHPDHPEFRRSVAQSRLASSTRDAH